jgi:FkbM family methyltransferase
VKPSKYLLAMPVRSVYRRIFRRAQIAELYKMHGFYSQFVGRGDLVFDVGANAGEYAEAFALTGARVVAIEANPAFMDRLNSLSRRIVAESCAAGAADGTATINICSQPAYSTLNTEWLARTADFPDYRGVEWQERRTVPLLTLDTLAKRHGVPRFVKIDVEGFEVEVLKGMTFRPETLCFEFSARNKVIGLDCISILSGYRFRPIIGHHFSFAHPEWLSADQALQWLRSYSCTDGENGDLFAQRA